MPELINWQLIGSAWNWWVVAFTAFIVVMLIHLLTQAEGPF
jgi:hypothetical protein